MSKSTKYNYAKRLHEKHANIRYYHRDNNTNGLYSSFNSFSSKLILQVFIVFIILVIIDYFLTIYNISKYQQEFNPVVVSIYKNFNYPELFFLIFKIIVIFLNGLVLFLFKKWKNKLGNELTEKISRIYVTLIFIFALGVVLYDFAIIKGIDVSIVNQISTWFFKSLGFI